MKTAITSLLPLFHDKTKPVAMIKHAMDVAKKLSIVVNPQQVLVIALDQPLFAIAS